MAAATSRSTPGSTAANSSPPSRPTTARGATSATTSRRRSARRTSSWSPAACPPRSLTSLNRSTSMNSTAPPSASAARPADIRWPRLARPVSGSCRALRWRSRSQPSALVATAVSRSTASCRPSCCPGSASSESSRAPSSRTLQHLLERLPRGDGLEHPALDGQQPGVPPVRGHLAPQRQHTAHQPDLDLQHVEVGRGELPRLVVEDPERAQDEAVLVDQRHAQVRADRAGRHRRVVAEDRVLQRVRHLQRRPQRDHVGAERELVGHVRVRHPHAALGREALLVGTDEVDDRDRGVHRPRHVGDDGVEVGVAGVAAEPVAVDRGQPGRLGDGGSGVGQVVGEDGEHPENANC